MIWGSCVICETVTSLIYYSWVFNLRWSFYPLIPWFPFLDSFVLPWIFYFSITFRMCSNSNNLDQLHVIIPDFFSFYDLCFKLGGLDFWLQYLNYKVLFCCYSHWFWLWPIWLFSILIWVILHFLLAAFLHQVVMFSLLVGLASILYLEVLMSTSYISDCSKDCGWNLQLHVYNWLNNDLVGNYFL